MLVDITVGLIGILLACGSPPIEDEDQEQNVEQPNLKNMVLIPAGEFLMGNPEGEGAFDEHPQHKVYLDDFYIDKYEVTNAQFKEFVEATGYVRFAHRRLRLTVHFVHRRLRLTVRLVSIRFATQPKADCFVPRNRFRLTVTDVERRGVRKAHQRQGLMVGEVWNPITPYTHNSSLRDFIHVNWRCPDAWREEQPHPNSWKDDIVDETSWSYTIHLSCSDNLNYPVVQVSSQGSPTPRAYGLIQPLQFS